MYRAEVRATIAHMCTDIARRWSLGELASNAHAVGWRDQAHAAQQFRKLTGLSPTEYRAETRSKAVAECFWCGQPLPTSAGDGDPRVLDGDQSVHG